jgi:ABC-type transport system substrate-binding protein
LSHTDYLTQPNTYRTGLGGPGLDLPIDSAHSSVDNRNQFEYLMYRPLYWFGDNDEPVLNSSLSLADPPVYSDSDKTVTITLKNYKWSNGEAVTSQDVAFWLNMLAAEKTNWAYYVPGGLPDNLSSWKVTSPSTIVLHLKTAYSPDWFTDNELSQITPLPAGSEGHDLAGGHAGAGLDRPVQPVHALECDRNPSPRSHPHGKSDGHA